MTLSIFDENLYAIINRLGRTGYLDEDPRGTYKDGTPSHSLSVRGSVFEVYDLDKGEFPITFTRPIYTNKAFEEINVIYEDASNLIADFEKRSVNWWKEWDIGDGTIGHRYGYTVAEYDLLNNLLKDLEENPFGKRHIMNLLQYVHLRGSDGLYPCAYETQWSVSVVDGERYLDMTLIQRSSDLLVAGTGINQMQYVYLQMRIACHLGIKPGLFEHARKNVHIYDRHPEQLKITIDRLVSMSNDDVERKAILKLNAPSGTNFYDIKVSDFELLDYDPIKPQIKFDLAI